MVIVIIAGAARRAGPDSMLILYLCICVCICVSETISRPLIGRNSETSRDIGGVGDVGGIGDVGSLLYD